MSAAPREAALSPPQAGRRLRRSPPLVAWGLLLALAAGASFAAIHWPREPVLEAWLTGFVILSGFVTASLALLMIGHLLGEAWLDPVRDELEPAAWTMPLIAILAVPVLVRLDQLFPWTDGREASTLSAARQSFFDPLAFTLRTAAYLAIWTALAFAVARPGVRRRASAIGLAILAPTVALAAIDWVLSREPMWWSSLFAFAFTVSQLLAALAGSILITLAWQAPPTRERFRSLEAALLTLALLTLWVWFSQFLVVWMADLPGEAAWYVARVEGWSSVKLVFVVPTLLLAIALLIPPRVGRRRLLLASGLVLIHHVAHMLWIAGPLKDTPPGWTALIVLAALGAVWLAWLVVGMRWRQLSLAT